MKPKGHREGIAEMERATAMSFLHGSELLCLPWILLGLWSTPQEDTHISLAQALYGTPLVLPNQYLSLKSEHTMNEFIIQIDQIF
jgi:hypothetical protein